MQNPGKVAAALVVCATMLLLAGCQIEPAEYQYVLTFTSSLDSSMPTDNLTTISLDEYHNRQIYAHVYWYNLNTRSYDYYSEWRGPDGSVMSTGSMTFSPTDPTWLTWSSITVDKYDDDPGKWVFTIDMNLRQEAVLGTLSVVE